MTRRIICVALLTAIFALTSTSAMAASQKIRQVVKPGKAIGESEKSLAYSFAHDARGPYPERGISADQINRIPLGAISYSSSADSPGEVFGGTYADYQQNGSMGRMIGTGPHSGETGPTYVHFSWMYLPDSVWVARTYAYNAYASDVGQYAGEALLHDPETEYSGYVQIDVTPDNRAVVGGHCNLAGPGAPHYMAQIHFDQCPACKDFDTYIRLPDSMGEYMQAPSGDAQMSWPKFMLQFGTDTVLHIITGNGNDYFTLAYTRNIRPEGTASYWASMPYLFDSTYGTTTYDLAGPRTGDRVAMCWAAPPNYGDPSCDTCSGPPLYEGLLIGQYDNDIYYQVSENQGAIWQPRVNLTQIDWTQDNYKTYMDASMIMDTDGYIHITWAGTPFPPDTCLDPSGNCLAGPVPAAPYLWDGIRLFHWSENVPYIRTIMDYTLPPSDSCGPEWYWSSSVAKHTISQCQDKLYIIWTQFHDLPNGIENDCAQWGYDLNTYFGPANGDIWMAISNDGGLTWDAPRNLTNSYTPHCNPNGGIECESDYYASMSLYGRQKQVSENWSAAAEVIPEGGAATDWFLDVQYLNDMDAGTMVDLSGTWKFSPLKWFRLACVDPVMAPAFTPQYWEIAQPAWENPGIQKDTSLTIENIGNVDLSYNINVVEDNGPAGWLTISGFSGFIPSGLGNVETATIHLNTAGKQATPDVLYGRLVFNGTDPDFPDTIEIEFIVADTVIFPQYDTVTNSCLTLACGINGSAGRQGWGGVNMDYQSYNGVPVDCDTSIQASVYLYESSVMFAEGDGAQWSSSLWSVSWLTDDGLRPQGGQVVSRCCPGLGAQVFESGRFTNSDTSIAFERIWVAPHEACNYIIEYLKVWPLDEQTHTGLTIGQVDDWDLPCDDVPGVLDRAGNDFPFNYGGIDPGNKLVWMQGYECYCDGDSIYPYNCAEGEVETMYDDERFGGNAFVESYLNGSPHATAPYGAWAEENDSTWAPGVGFEEDIMYDYMTTGGWWAIDSIEDLHTGMCFEPSMSLADGEYYEVVTIIASIHKGTLSDLQTAVADANTWYGLKGGMTMFADINGDEAGQIDICEMDCFVRGDIDGLGYTSSADVIYFVDWLWKGGDPPPHPDEVDCNGSCTNSSADLLYLVDYLWKGGPPPVPCE